MSQARRERPRTERAPAAGRGRGPAPERRGGSAITPIRVALFIALIGSVAYVAYAIAVVRDTSAIPMLASGAAVLGIVFLALAIASAQGIVRAGREGRGGGAMMLALGGGLAAMTGFGCFAAAIILGLVLQP